MAKKRPAPKATKRATPRPAKKSAAKPKQAKAAADASRKITGDFELGQIYGVDKKSVYNWRQAGMPAKKLPGNKWEYDLDQTDPWVEDKRESTTRDAELAAIKKEKEQTKLRIEKAKADQVERRNQLEEGNVLERDVWELFAAEAIQEMRDGILRVPTFFHGHLCKKCQHKTSELKDQLEDVLIRFATKLREGPTDEE